MDSKLVMIIYGSFFVLGEELEYKLAVLNTNLWLLVKCLRFLYTEENKKK